MKIVQRTFGIIMALALVSWGFVPAALAQTQRAYRYNDNQMRNLLRRLETRTDRFSDLLPNALDRSRIDGTRREDNVNQLVTDFERATDLLQQNFEQRRSTQSDAEAVLRDGAMIDRFMNNRRLDYRTEQAWTQVKAELNRLAATYGVARDWNTRVWPPVAVYDTNARLTGTFRLNPTRSQNPAVIVANATRGLQYNQRQRISDRLIERLTPPSLLSLERVGNLVTLASTQSPRVTIDADGRTHSESYPNGRSSTVQASFYGEQLKVVSNGDRANDFTATFTPMEGGRTLMVTRQVYAERLNEPVTVESYYDRTADMARWDIYSGSSYPSNAGNVRDGYLIADGTTLIARLNVDLSTKTDRANDRFTMTVISPMQFNGAVIEGYLSDVDRGGRITGRSEMGFNFERVRTLDGRTFDFAGLVEAVRPVGGGSVRVDNEGGVAESDSRTDTTITRTAIGTAVGAIIGAIAGGGKGAAIGAGVGAGAGAGSVYIQGHDDLTLARGTEFTVRASAPMRR